MNAYKIDLSGFTGKVREVVIKALFAHGEKLGYNWSGDKPPSIFSFKWMYFESSGFIKRGEKDFTDWGNVLITADAFLALTTAKDETSFKTEQFVLVRDKTEGEWSLAQYSHRRDHSGRFVVMGGIGWDQCIHYEGNEALLGTTDSPE